MDAYDTFPALTASSTTGNGRRVPPVPNAGHTRPAQPRPTPAAALRALLHTRLAVRLADGRVLTGHLLAVDDSGSLLLSSVTERRVLPDTLQGRNVAMYYPFSTDATGSAPKDEPVPGALSGVDHHGEGECESTLDIQVDSGALPVPPVSSTRIRELASVLVPMKHVIRVDMDDSDATAWGRYAGVQFADGAAVPPVPTRS